MGSLLVIWRDDRRAIEHDLKWQCVRSRSVWIARIADQQPTSSEKGRILMAIEPALRGILTRPRMDRFARKETGIVGLDQVTGGGLPIGRMIAITGSPGCGKSNLALQMLAHRATAYGEPEILASFEESEQSIRQNTVEFRWATDAFQANNLHILELRGHGSTAPA